MNYLELKEQIERKKSFLCVGLDTVYDKIPQCLLSPNTGRGEAMLKFNQNIIDATAPYTVAYKPNLAFYSCEGLEGIKALIETVKYIKTNYPDTFVILDAKYGDIGNTAQRYAQTAFETIDADAVTLNPYMGKDCIAPFLSYPDRWSVILALTSNPGSQDFQQLWTGDEISVYQQVLYRTSCWGSRNNTMFVVGATRAEMLKQVRQIVPNHFLLVPGVGAQGGSLQKVAAYGMDPDYCGLLVNSSRGIIYASNDNFFALMAKNKAREMQKEMETLLLQYSNLL